MGEDERNMSTPLLDRSRKYVILGRDEKIWIFAWERSYIGDDSAHYWQCYFVRPGGLVVAQGPRDEREVYEFLDQHSHKLDADDKLDLALFLHKGGLESFLKENRNGSTR